MEWTQYLQVAPWYRVFIFTSRISRRSLALYTAQAGRLAKERAGKFIIGLNIL
jgi:hypothetical protein